VLNTQQDACEMYPDGVPGTFLRGAFFGTGFKHLDPVSDGTKIRQSESGGLEQDHSWDLDPSTDAFYLWSGLLSEYTNCLLTQNSDKLIAVSAIARFFQPTLNDEYVAGLWKRHIGQHLLWRLSTPQKVTAPLPTSETHRPPSWSWASVIGRVDAYNGLVRHDKPLMIKVLEVKVENLTADTMGHVTSGCIKVQGWLKHFPPPKGIEDEDEDEDDDGTWMVKMPGRFETLGDEALKFLTRPTYPFEKAPEGEGGDNVRVGRIKSKTTFGWPFQKNPWVESVINIV